MINNRISLLGIPVDAYTMDQTVDLIDENIFRNTPIHHVVVNAAKLVYSMKNRELRDSIINCDVINPDGQSVVWASRFLKRPLKERVTGIDLMERLIERAYQRRYKIFLLGAEEEVVNEVVKKYTDKYGTDIIAGYRNGYFNASHEESVAHMLADSGAHMLFVAMTSPKKEIFLNKYKNLIKIPFIMGVGGSFDVISGKTKRAPVWMQKLGIEWLYRVLQEPRRLWKRYLTTNSLFIYYVLKEKFSSNRHVYK